jgi:hypothetical protein
MLLAKRFEALSYQGPWATAREKDVVTIPRRLVDHDTRVPFEIVP